MAVGVAEALDYLHNGCEEPVIHKDVKSSNILLSDDFEPQVHCLTITACFYLGLYWMELPKLSFNISFASSAVRFWTC